MRSALFSVASNSRIYIRAAGNKALPALSSIRPLCVPPDKPSVDNKVKDIGKLALYAQLAKFRLSSLVVVTSGAGYICFGPAIDAVTLSATCIGTALCAGSANSFNQLFEREYDKLMKRTHNRPLPSGRVSPTEAAVAGTAMGAAGVGILSAMTNPVVTALGAGNILLYSGLYTFSKRKTELNTWIGSVVGAVPPLMGYASASGGAFLTGDAAILSGLLFLWQFPHFFALSWMYRDDYARGGFQMVAVNDPSGVRTAKLITEYSLYLTALPLVATAAGLTSSMYAVEGTVANAYLLYLANNFNKEHSNGNARKIFLCSLWYLPFLLLTYIFHSKNWKSMELSTEVTAPMNLVLRAKEVLKGMCIHEVMVQKHESNSGGVDGTTEGISSSSSSGGALCPKVVIEKAAESVGVTVGDSTRITSQNSSNISVVSTSSGREVDH